ncbi:30S ribosomal protein S9 [Chloroflexota bacterium]
MDKQTYYCGTGRRKCAVARARLSPGKGAVVINGRPLEELFPHLEQRQIIQQPLLATDTASKYSVMIKVAGGGISGQCGAISHGIARALVAADENLRPVLRQYGMLTRDARVKERKKPGLKRARKAPQYTKR